jgi:hypothetical protein
MVKEDGGFDGARDHKGVVVISESMLRYWLPAFIKPLTDTQKETCGCDDCIVGDSTVKTLNAWESRTLHVMKLGEERARGSKRTQLKTQWCAFKNAVYPDQNHDDTTSAVKLHHRYEKPRDIVDQLTCHAIDYGGHKVHKLRCALSQCTKDGCGSFEKLCVPKLEADVSQTAREINFDVYRHHSFCSMHHSLPPNEKTGNGPTKCPSCMKTGKQGKVIRKKHLTRHRKPIGLFFKDHLHPFFASEYRYHQFKMAMLGKHHTTKDRKAAALKVPGAVFSVSDYTDAFVQELHLAVQSDHFGDHQTVGMEGHYVTFARASGEMDAEAINHYFAFLSDDNRQDARTTHANMEKLVPKLRELGLLPQGSTKFENMDGCCKQ